MHPIVDRLRQRKIVQWALAYLAGAWLVMQVVDVLGERWLWPLGAQRMIDVALLVGFAVMLVLAWYHGESGRQRVSGPELLILALLFAIGGTVVAAAGRGASGAGATDTSPAAAAAPASLPAATSGDDRPALAVLPFENRSGRDDDIFFTDGVHDEILSRLSGV